MFLASDKRRRSSAKNIVKRDVEENFSGPVKSAPVKTQSTEKKIKPDEKIYSDVDAIRILFS